MCSRFFVDQELAEFLSGLEPALAGPVKAGDVRPSQSTFVWSVENDKPIPRLMIWGFPKKEGKELLINARTESVLEKPSFRDAALSRRCVIPASGFYEWDRSKNKVTFKAREKHFLYMAGVYTRYGEEPYFVVLTTKADQTVLPVHHRMPLLFDRNSAMSWLLAGDEQEIKTALSRESIPVEITEGYIQEKFPFL